MVPFRISVMQLTMKPLAEMVRYAKVMDHYGFDALWLAEAYPWWRKHAMEARSATAFAPVLARETERLAIGLGIVSSYSRHPLQLAMEARVIQEAAGRDRFLLGLGASKIFMKAAGLEDGVKPRTNLLESLSIVRSALAGEELAFEGDQWIARTPPLDGDAEAPSWPVPMYIAGTGPRMQESAGEFADGLLTPSITTPDFVQYALENVRRGAARSGRSLEDVDIGCTIVASIDEDAERGREGAREIAGMYLANKVQNIQGDANVLLDMARLSRDDLHPIAEAMERGGRFAAKAAVTDEIFEKTKAIAGTPEECIKRIEEYREAGCRHILLELWGDDRERQLHMFGEQVLPHVGQGELV